MTIPKIGDFLLMTPHLRTIVATRGRRVSVEVPRALVPLYDHLDLLPSDPPDWKTPDRILDLSVPEMMDVPPEFERLAQDAFAGQHHASVGYSRAMHRYFPEVSETFRSQPYLDLDIDEGVLRARRLAPFAYFTIHTGSDFPPKNWPEANYRVTLELIHAEFPHLKCVELVGPGDRPLFAPGGQPAWLTSVREPLLSVARLLAGAAFHLDNDSGIHHLAGAMDVPTISVWGPTAPGTWSSVTARNFVHWGGPSCADHCRGARMHACLDRVCLTSVKPQSLMPSVRTILSAY